MGRYNETDLCDRCKKEKLTQKKSFKEYDKKGNWTKNWLCRKCYERDRYIRGETNSNIRNSLRDRRTGNLKDPGNILGDNCEELTHRWLGIERLGKKNDCYNGPLDHSVDQKLGIIETSGSVILYGTWSFANLGRYQKKIFDNVICYCITKDRKYIERIYIFPRKEILVRTHVHITKDNIRGSGWYEQYRINDIKIIEQINKLYKEIIC